MIRYFVRITVPCPHCGIKITSNRGGYGAKGHGGNGCSSKDSAEKGAWKSLFNRISSCSKINPESEWIVYPDYIQFNSVEAADIDMHIEKKANEINERILGNEYHFHFYHRSRWDDEDGPSSAGVVA
jgi:hypothetical protein